jgi:ribose transport system substrate-binding protein
MNMRKWILATAAGAALTSLSCVPMAHAAGTIGVSMHFMADDYAKAFADEVQKKGKELGLDVVVYSADGNPQKQLSDIQSLVTQQVNAIVVIPIDEVAIVPGLKDAAAANIPIISASPVPGAADILTAVVGPSDFENGKAACAEMVDAMKAHGQGMNVGISTASVTLYRIDQRVAGCEAALDEAGAKVIDTVKGLSPEEGLANAQNLLSAHPDIGGIFGSFSNLVIGAGNALKQANNKDVAVSGIDADRSIIQLILQDWVTDVAAQFPSQQADLIAQAAADVVAGKPVEKDQQNLLPSRTVDKSNAKDRYKEIWGEEMPN